jgi:hypothetical protein
LLITTPSKLLAEKTLEEGGIIADTFFGQLQSFIQYKDSQENMKFQEVNESFAEVLLSIIGTKDLYESWENMN